MTCDPCGAISGGHGKKLPKGWFRSVDGILFCYLCVVVAKATNVLRPGRPARGRFSGHTKRIR